MKYSKQSIRFGRSPHWLKFAAAAVIAAVIAGCGGGGGGGAAPTTASATPTVPVPAGTPITLSASTPAATFAALAPVVPAIAVSINSPPVIAFSVTDSNGNPVVGLGSTSQKATDTVASYPNIAFSLAKLVPGVGTAPSKWVSYVVTTVPTYKKASAPFCGNDTALKNDACNINASAPTRPSTDSNGKLVDNKNGTYTYTFYRDITKAKELVDAATDSGNNKKADLGDLTYEPNLVHRLTIQISGNAPGTGTNTPTGANSGVTGVPLKKPVDAIYDFIPATGKAVTATDPSRDITATAKCNECHYALGGIPGDTSADSGAAFHGGSRNETKYCVVCHTEQRKYGRAEATTTATGYSGSTYRINDFAVGNFPNMIHKTHFGKMLTKDGYDFAGVKFNEVKFPQDARNCTKCHDGSATSTAKTAQGDNWLNVPGRVACGGCHDAINFAAGTITKGGVTKGHPFDGAPQSLTSDAQCSTCHTAEVINVTHLAVTPPNPANALLAGGTNANTNSAWIASNTSRLPAGAIKVTYDIQSVSRDANKKPVMVFRMLQNGVAVPLIDRTANPTATEIWANFMGAPSVYFVYAMPQDGIAAPADFNASASSYLRSLWNGSASGTGAGTLTGPDANGYYTATLTGVTIPDTAVMLTGGLGFSYNVKTALPLTQTNLPAYPTADATGSGLTAGMPNKTGGLIVIAPNVSKVATAYAARRAIVSDAKCNNCHQELGTFTEDSFHAGQRNDGTTCSWCHTPNRTSSGWSADSTSFVHAIHAGNKRTVPFNWHAISATEGFWDVKYPGVLKQCETCHLPGTYDFSAAGSTVPSPNNRQYRTVATGNSATATISTSPYVAQVAGTAYGSGYSVSAATGTVTQAAGTTLVTSPITAVCFACHDNDTTASAALGETPVAHMKRQGGSIYAARSTALGTVELCATCHGANGAVAISSVHSTQ
jgi:OmcA/MtrC family decaheme c-type cytochrome